MSRKHRSRCFKEPTFGSHFISVVDKDNNFIAIEVPEEIYLYIRQLEGFILNDRKSNLLNSVYKERFEKSKFNLKEKDKSLLSSIYDLIEESRIMEYPNASKRKR